jgi:hypothetical protein
MMSMFIGSIPQGEQTQPRMLQDGTQGRTLVRFVDLINVAVAQRPDPSLTAVD